MGDEESRSNSTLKGLSPFSKMYMHLICSSPPWERSMSDHLCASLPLQLCVWLWQRQRKMRSVHLWGARESHTVVNFRRVLILLLSSRATVAAITGFRQRSYKVDVLQMQRQTHFPFIQITWTKRLSEVYNSSQNMHISATQTSLTHWIQAARQHGENRLWLHFILQHKAFI